MKAEQTKKGEVKESERDFYEVGLLMVPTMTEEEATATLSKMITSLEKQGGVIKQTVTPATRPLTYDMTQVVGSKRSTWSTAYFTSVTFEYDVDLVKALELSLKEDTSIIRSLVIAVPTEAFTPRERRIPASHKEEVKTDAVNVSAVAAPTLPLNEEELDKTIENLVIE